ncbi:hypothetical protein TRVA0_006S03928 [Trichomonascus vanleenenianus]|uniref:Far8p n=1 Tax=Trichomonascus vanleenenianus TaxID=2268995 RepID=UPI003ECB1D41
MNMVQNQAQQNGPNRNQPEYSLPGVMRYLQTEWQRNERDRIQWELERAEMKARISKLEGEKRGLQLVASTQQQKIRDLEKKLGVEPSEENIMDDSKKSLGEEIQSAMNVDLDVIVRSREYLEKCVQEIEYLLQSSSLDQQQQQQIQQLHQQHHQHAAETLQDTEGVPEQPQQPQSSHSAPPPVTPPPPPPAPSHETAEDAE